MSKTACETPSPIGVTENYVGISEFDRVILRRQGAANGGIHTEHSKVVSGNDFSLSPLRRAIHADINRRLISRGDARKGISSRFLLAWSVFHWIFQRKIITREA
jgi:hypothetical protein